jgi:hypothetical protein
MTRPLTDADRIEAFRLATTGFESAAERWEAAAKRGVNDDEPAEMLRFEIGIFGCRSSQEGLNVEFQGAALRIWATWESTARTKYPPIFQGNGTVRMARRVYGVADPRQRQMSLF